jgi:hypothetical protein
VSTRKKKTKYKPKKIPKKPEPKKRKVPPSKLPQRDPSTGRFVTSKKIKAKPKASKKTKPKTKKNQSRLVKSKAKKVARKTQKSPKKKPSRKPKKLRLPKGMVEEKLLVGGRSAADVLQQAQEKAARINNASKDEMKNSVRQEITDIRIEGNRIVATENGKKLQVYSVTNDETGETSVYFMLAARIADFTPRSFIDTYSDEITAEYSVDFEYDFSDLVVDDSFAFGFNE